MESFQIRTVDRLVALISERNVYRILMEPCQNKRIKILAFLLIRGYKNVCDRLIDLRLVFKTKLCRIISVYRSTHCRKGRLRIIRGTPADIELLPENCDEKSSS